MFYLFKNGECDTMCRSRKGLEKLIPKNTADEYVILEFDGFHTPYDLYIENGEIREALQNPLLPSRMKQKCSVRFFRTASKNPVFALEIV